MCGIVGYIGNKNADNILIQGLKRLEYRGYDSAGIATLDDDNKITLARAKGKVVELENKLPKTNTNKIGIGHTRWATHGVPSEVNAHPHRAGDLYLVHNGIIENYKELKDKLVKHDFKSQTDTEVLVALIDNFYKDGVSLVDAVNRALKLVRGTYGIAVISAQNPDEIVVARMGSPLIIGLGKDETYIASDASALIGHTKKAVYLNDGEIAVCTAGEVSIRTLDNEAVVPQIEQIEIDVQAIQKQGYDHFLLKEIFEQPTVLKSTLSGRLLVNENSVHLGGLNISDKDLRAVQHITIVGCGTAYYAGLLASYYLEKIIEGITVDVVIASEFRYRAFHMPKNSVALIVSQSGETADTLACLREIKRRGVKTLGIVNVVGSTIAREVDGGIYVHAGPEISVASTKAFTSQTTAMILFGIKLAQVKDSNPELISEYLKELSMLPDEIETVLKKSNKTIETIANKYSRHEHALFIGRDTLYPVALEGALKLKEVSYIQAEGYAAGELKHGPIALIDDRFFEVALIMDNWLFDKSMSAIEEMNARGGHIIAITDSAKNIPAETIIKVSTKLKLLTPLVINVIQQLLAYYISVDRGNDVDQPRNLAKSVTVE